jgi:hypothetical protein
MPERDQNISETTEQIGNGLIEFIEKTEFGTPEYQAVSDYLYLRESEERLKQEQKNALLAKDDADTKSYWEGRARISEQKIALLELSIHQNQSRIKGYESAYVHVGIGFEHSLVTAAYKEAKQLFAHDTEQQDFYVNNLSARFLDQAENIIHSKMA